MSRGETRHPWLVVILIIFTFGIYGLVWFYQIHAEMRQHTPDPSISPSIRVALLFVPIYNLVVLYWHTPQYVRNLQAARGIPPEQQLRGGCGLWFLTILTFGIIYYVFIQDALNRIWEMADGT